MKIGIIDVGVISRLHLRAYKKIADSNVIALCDLNESKLRKKFENRDRRMEIDTSGEGAVQMTITVKKSGDEGQTVNLSEIN